MTCDLCAHANRTGSWPTSHRGTHCEDCHRSWAGHREAHCTVCHAHFTSDSLAEKHRVNSRCLTRDEMLITRTESGKPVFRTDASKYGEIWRYGETLTVKPAYMVDR